MKKVKDFTKKHMKKFIGGGVLVIVTFGGYILYKILKK